MNEQNSSGPDVGQCLSEGWELYKREPALLSGVMLISVILNAIAGAIPFANLLIYGPLVGGLYLLIIRIDKGESVSIGGYFDAFRAFVPLLLVTVLTSLFVFLGMIALILPGLYLALAYSFSTLNVMRHGMDFWPAMEASRKLVNAHFVPYLLLALVFIVICFIGAIPFGLGLLVAVPVCLAAQYSFYKSVSEAE